MTTKQRDAVLRLDAEGQTAAEIVAALHIRPTATSSAESLVLAVIAMSEVKLSRAMALLAIYSARPLWRLRHQPPGHTLDQAARLAVPDQVGGRDAHLSVL